MTHQQMKTLLGFGYSFTPSEGMLVDYYLRNKVLDEPMDYCVIEEVDNVYNIHPQDLAGVMHKGIDKVQEFTWGVSQAWYFFTRSPFELQSSKVLARWICSSEKEDIYLKDVKVGVKQRFEFCEGCRNRYSITEYQLCSPPENPKNGHWFVCQLKMIGNSVDELMSILELRAGHAM
ncbi:hypothetical protein IFM89_038596 [Coptis chinensis]|uniref:NAC domain-containing protein n=1 Tax=Coptis chinensis TaxID=261450 RepID=A0A835I0C8_9MAGN|nr:hypothetical protein IFM89_038596 [Coptis chinensis]